MGAVVVVLVALVAWAWLARRERVRGPIPAATWEPFAGSRGAWTLAWLVVAIAHAAYLRGIPTFAGPGTLMWADQYAHAAIGQALAKGALTHGWIDTYNGGFPFGPHYPSLGWLVIAALVRIGVPAVNAMKALGVASTLAVPAVVLVFGRRVGLRPASAALAAIAVSTVTPYTSFAGGWGTFLMIGLVSQALAVPIVIAWSLALFDRRSLALAPLLAALAVAAHPQIFSAAALVVLVVALASFDAHAKISVARSFVAAGALGIALYGPGVATLHVPFGWPPMEPWKTVGYGTRRLGDWLGDGELLDWERVPVCTYAWIAATIVTLARARSRVCRGVAVAALAAMMLAVSGRWYVHLGALGAFLSSFLQPMRALALVPVAAAATIAVAFQEVTAIVRGVAATRSAPFDARIARASSWVVVVAFAALVFPSNARFASAIIAVQRDEMRGGGDCARRVPGFDASTVTRWAATRERGRLAFDTSDGMEHCAAVNGVELASAVPLAESLGAGAHVGVHSMAFQQVRPTAPGSAARAEALGIRTLVHRASRRPTPPEEWRTVATSGEVEMSERVAGTDLVGVGCITNRWSGSDAALRDALFDDLNADAHVLEDPRSLTELRTTSGPVTREPVPQGDCDASKSDVRESKREPGAYEAIVTSPRDVDVVFRASAFPTWTVHVDAARVATVVVAPGFVAARVQAGTHHVTAEVAPLRGYVAGVVVAFAIVLLVSARVIERLRGARRRRAAHAKGANGPRQSL